MGLSYLDLETIYNIRCGGVSFSKTLTVGRQSLYLFPSEIRAIRRWVKVTRPESDSVSRYRFGTYADGILRDLLSIDRLDVLDFSSYEGANIIHDLNSPLTGDVIGTYDAVIDGGSLEHVFNFPVAVANLMRLLKVGGHLFLNNPSNNWCGHGFYQFSPEVMYRIFVPENGFELIQAIVFRAKNSSPPPYRDAFAVNDSAVVGDRVELRSRHPISLFIIARKINDELPFRKWPQQNMYVDLWSGRARRQRWLREAFHRLPLFLQSWLGGAYRQRKFSLSNRHFFKKIN